MFLKIEINYLFLYILRIS